MDINNDIMNSSIGHQAEEAIGNQEQVVRAQETHMPNQDLRGYVGQE